MLFEKRNCTYFIKYSCHVNCIVPSYLQLTFLLFHCYFNNTTVSVIKKKLSQYRVTVADINDEAPVFEEREGCTMITEFHEPRETVTVVRASDGDDPTSPNGRILFTIEGGNEKGELLR